MYPPSIPMEKYPPINNNWKSKNSGTNKNASAKNENALHLVLFLVRLWMVVTKIKMLYQIMTLLLIQVAGRLLSIMKQQMPFASSIIIDGVGLNHDSIMKDLLLYSSGEDNSIHDEYDLEPNSKNGKKLYFKVKVKNGREFLFKKSRFLNSTSVDLIYSLESVISPLSIVIIPK